MDPKQWLRKNPDRAGAWLAMIVGALVLYVGWEGASTTEYPAEQLPYILSGGIGGALLVAVGATLLISADLRDEWRKLDRIERRLAAKDADAAAPPAATAPEAETEPAATEPAATEPDAEETDPEASPPRANGRKPRVTAKR